MPGATHTEVFPAVREDYVARHGTERFWRLLSRKLFSIGQRNLPLVSLRRGCARALGIRVARGGKAPWLGGGVYLDDLFPELITIGEGAVLGLRSMVICHDDATRRVAPVVIGPGSYVGAGAILLPGVTLGEGVRIGAGAVVTRSIPAHETWAGVPARRLHHAEASASG